MPTPNRHLSRSLSIFILLIVIAAIVFPADAYLRSVSAADDGSDRARQTRHKSAGGLRTFGSFGSIGDGWQSWTSSPSAAQPGDKPSQDGIWQEISGDLVPAGQKLLAVANKYRIYRLNIQAFSKLVAQAPLEFSSGAKIAAVVLTLPMPDGKFSRFRIEDSPILAPHLAAAFPAWKTLQGYGIDDPTATARLDWTASGFHGYIFTRGGTVYVDPYQENDRENYLVYYKHDYRASARDGFSCKIDEFASNLETHDLPTTPNAVAFANGANIRTYRIAIATTGEWARSTTMSTDPQTVRTAALASMTTSVNRLDGIFRREVAVSFQLVNPAITDNTTNIIFDDPATDPYNNTDQTAQLTINQTTIDTRVGIPNYDVGHLYGTGGGGVATTPSVCDTDKAQGYSARGGTPGDPFTVDYVAHEIGHQFGGNHTYNNADNGGACTTRSATNAFEVGSGSTIMSYVGICNERNLQQFVDTGTPSFHIRSLTEIVGYIQNPTGGGACGTTSGANSIPTVNPGASFTIPRLTPFTLTATANDADPGDVANLLHSWEQYDLAPSATGVMGTPAGAFDVDTDSVLRPLFRAYSPVASASRTFPSMPFILNPANNAPAGTNNPPLTYTGTHPSGLPGAGCETNVTCVTGENLPSVSRTMNFRVSVRDQRGGTVDAGTTVAVAAAAGPFRVTTQDVAPVQWQTGTVQTVTWDVAGTTANGINAANVKASLSTDGGQTFPITLLASTPNDGSEAITVPNNLTTTARIKIEAIGNIFFDISNVNFTIVQGTPTVSTVQFSASTAAATETPNATTKVELTVTRTGSNADAATVNYATADGTAIERSDYLTALGTIRFLAGESSKTVPVFIVDDSFGETPEIFTVTLSNPIGSTLGATPTITVTINSNEAVNGPNPARDASFSSDFFVRQHYFDFLNREPDAGGLAFWIGQTTGCGNADLLVCRINVSAAFFLSVEFQETGYYAIRARRVAFANKSDVAATRVTLAQFIRDARQIGDGFVDLQPGSAAVLEANKQAFASQIVASAEFVANFPTSQTAAQYVAALYAKAGVTPTATETQQAVDAYNGAANSTAGRIAAFRNVTDSTSVRDGEFRAAFVLLQYFGYLRRDPDQPGYAFWLAKLNQFNGNFVTAEMVKAFINSDEYLQRFGP